jgi:hypothetical protein
MKSPRIVLRLFGSLHTIAEIALANPLLPGCITPVRYESKSGEATLLIRKPHPFNTASCP